MNFPKSKWYFLQGILVVLALITGISGCRKSSMTTISPLSLEVPHQEDWGIYELNLITQEVRLIYSTPNEFYASDIRLNSTGEKLVFAHKAGGSSDTDLEIYSIEVDGYDLIRLTNNKFLDVYPVWSPDDRQIDFLSQREKDLDIYTMDADGSDVRKLYDSGYNDADIDWADKHIVFTSQFAIWKMNDDGTQPFQLTFPPNRGQWGKANLPAGDYDPRLSPDGKRVTFERLEDTTKPNGGYNLFVINIDGTGETRLTDTGYAQGLASWSHSEDRIVYGVAAINGQGKYRIYMMNSDGTHNRDITPDYFPTNFLCHSPIFSKTDLNIFFIGQWWE